MAKGTQGKYLETGTRIALLQHELMKLGAWKSMRLVQQAAEVFHEDVEQIEGAKI